MPKSFKPTERVILSTLRPGPLPLGSLLDLCDGNPIHVTRTCITLERKGAIAACLVGDARGYRLTSTPDVQEVR